MKILVVCQYYAPEPFRISDICETLVKNGHDVTVVTGLPNYPEGEIYPGYEKKGNTEEVLGGVRVHRCWQVPRKTGAAFRILNYYTFAWTSTLYLNAMKEDFDVVFVNQLSPVMMAQGAVRYAKKHKKPLVLYCLDLWPESLTAGGIRENSKVFRYFWKVSQKIYRAADRILVSSQGFVDYLKNKLGVESSYQHLPQYAETLFDDIAKYSVHDGPYHFVFAGNVGKMQSVETIIAAAQILKEDPRVVFDIVGDGSALEDCRNAAEGLPNVVFHGRRPVEEMPRFYAAADAMIISLADNPQVAATLPGKMQSYMAAGRCVLGSIGGEAASVIKDARCGLCAPAEDPVQLAECVRTLVEQPQLFETFANNAKSYYNQFFTKANFIQCLCGELEQAIQNYAK